MNDLTQAETEWLIALAEDEAADPGPASSDVDDQVDPHEVIAKLRTGSLPPRFLIANVGHDGGNPWAILDTQAPKTTSDSARVLARASTSETARRVCTALESTPGDIDTDDEPF